MAKEYLKIPLNFNALINLEDTARVDLKKSIAEHIQLIIATHHGEFKSDPDFGTATWQIDFDHSIANDQLRDLVGTSIKNAILKYEKRIESLEMHIKVANTTLNFSGQVKRFRKQVDVIIDAVIVATNEPVQFEMQFYIGPLSYN